MLSARQYLILGLMTAGILALPLIAMQFTEEVDWDVSDFSVAGVLICTAGYCILVLTQLTQSQLKKTALVMIVLMVLVLIWAQLAVGLI